MSVVLGRQSSYSARSISSASTYSMGGGMQLVGYGQTRISNAPIQVRTPSVYGGAGGFGTRISQSVVSSGSITPYFEGTVIDNEKVTMQNLNDRLASYLDKVRSLEAANRKLELQIREFYEKRTLGDSRDFSKFFAIISDLRAQILRKCTENQTINLQLDNAQLALDDFKIKYEMELSIRMNVEADVSRLRGVRDGLTLDISGLQMQIEGLKEELVYLKKNHEEAMRLARAQNVGTVNVEVESTDSVDLTKILQEIREQYESLVIKNKVELEKWFKAKIETLQAQMITTETEVKTYYTEMSELRRSYQSFEIMRESLIKEVQCLQQSLDEVKSRYSLQLNQLQLTITTLEMEMQQLKLSIEKQQTEYNLLLDIKMRLELEIAEYRRLLDGEKKAVIINKVVEEHKPHVERRVKTIVEEIVNGQVVSSVVDTKTEDITTTQTTTY